MKTVILAGGMGTRLAEETEIRPKPMVEIGGRPILWHIMKGYSACGHEDFVVCLGYKGYQIKEYFANYYLHEADVTFDLSKSNTPGFHGNTAESWKVTLVNTGEDTQTGGRLKRVKDRIGKETFMMTYGDGVSNVDVNEIIKFHRSHGKLATVTAVRPGGRFGSIDMGNDGQVMRFGEKSDGQDAWINAGFFVLEPKVLDLIKGDDVLFEKEPLETLAKEGQLVAFRHEGFWQPMDTMREKTHLENLWNSGRAPWKTWK